MESTAVKATAVIQLDQPKPISPDLFGVFFEDLNYAADGGLYAEIIQNRSFEYRPLSNPSWNATTAWEFTARGGGKGAFNIDAAVPIHSNNPYYAVLEVSQVGEGVGLMNGGFDGIVVKAGESYELSLLARHLYTGNRWGARPRGNDAIIMPMLARLESKDGMVLGEAKLEIPGRDWTRLTATIQATHSDDAARFVLLMNQKGAVALDVISLFPKRTFRDRPNGLRTDLAQAIADLKPRFIRFPGGCLVHGNGLGNMYRWKDTIGPIEHRKEQSNIWRYHQTVGLGYFEYFQFCEDIGAKPLPVVPAGVCCQNSDFTGGMGQRGIPMEQMPQYVQEVLDLIEWANGPATSTWGAKRAEAGHPGPFNLQYLGVGNEDAQTPEFRERFKMIYDAVKAKHPEITVIGTVGPSPKGQDFEQGWKFANELGIEMVDEHYYENPEWFLDNLNRYDAYDRARSKVYLGEFASRGNTLANALAEAAYMTSLERNGDVVRLASYAPLLARIGKTQWNPDLIYFDKTNVFPTVNYHVQQMFGANQGQAYLPTKLSCTPEPGKGQAICISCVQDSGSGDVIIKWVNVIGSPVRAQMQLAGGGSILPEATRTALAGDPKARNDPNNPRAVALETSPFAASDSFTCDLPAHSLTVLRLKTRK